MFHEGDFAVHEDSKKQTRGFLEGRTPKGPFDEGSIQKLTRAFHKGRTLKNADFIRDIFKSYVS